MSLGEAAPLRGTSLRDDFEPPLVCGNEGAAGARLQIAAVCGEEEIIGAELAIV
jgi:hypothetical protein